MRAVAEGLRLGGAVLLGAVTALAELAFLLLALPFLGNPNVWAATRRLARLEARRLRLDLSSLDALSDGRGKRAAGYLAARVPVGVLGGLVIALLVFGVRTAVPFVSAWARGEPFDGMAPSLPLGTYLGVAGFVALFLVLSGLAGVHALEVTLARRMLGPDPTEVLRRRITELAESRAGIVAAVDSERRRIERDLHDGLQQRLVALSMLIGRSLRGRTELMEQAHREAQQALTELREVAWRVYPSGLDSLGLGEALAGVAERSSVPVTVDCRLERRPPMAVETAAYFVVCEAVTNAAKHAGATRITVEVHEEEDAAVVVRVRDDGAGGAQATGSGLSGLARRVAALDGRFEVTSPAGGPTTITAVLPCG
ncbi:sensor histidine kinase [Nonomuraea gerenzanensis]|uniref:histidine kinase n=1 Tax=Nonomuraea gerenzanensis TaxID=93944 RepID=A0A1M4ECW8_9ACTN|nr:ATP-binding protein [Nonomuraea gerenzanensis]UBU18696.1 histidine kinase [Nonomuraea gerenzanensis]SBO96556.1 putative two-component system sensor kinase [Nonomuraea gerenzanensis]